MMISFMIFILSILCFLGNSKNILMILLSLELMSVGLINFMILCFSMEVLEMIMIFFIFLVSEACLGVVLLVLVSYFFGSENFKSLNF
uniref:NADH dehydrogenase subunit 4L n=1 Tax=Cosmolaelaps hrdyi TaxID=3126097 RepID=UPI0030E078A8